MHVVGTAGNPEALQSQCTHIKTLIVNIKNFGKPQWGRGSPVVWVSACNPKDPGSMLR